MNSIRLAHYAWKGIWLLAMGSILLACGVSEASLADKKRFEEEDGSYRNKFEFTPDSAEKVIRYGPYYIVSTMPDGYRVRVYHPEKRVLTEDCRYSTPALTLPHGECKRFWDDGSIREQGFYQYGRKHGIWLEAEPAKGKSYSGQYFNQRKEGEWTQLDTNGLIEAIFTWHDDQRHGKFYLFDSTGQKVNEGIYRADTLISELFKRPVFEKPYLKNCGESVFGNAYACTDYTLTQHVYANLRYPPSAKAMKMEGTALVQWDVLANGNVANLRVPQGLSNDIEAECLRVFRNMPAWMPARKDGRPVKYTMSIPINFKL
jgi:TonB family protein